MHRNADEIMEIERHKYFLSEKQGHDVGWDFAEQDWEANFAAQWREDQDQNPAFEQQPTVAVAQAVEITADDSPAESNVRLDPAIPGATSRDSGPLMRLFARLFAKTGHE